MRRMEGSNSTYSLCRVCHGLPQPPKSDSLEFQQASQAVKIRSRDILGTEGTANARVRDQALRRLSIINPNALAPHLTESTRQLLLPGRRRRGRPMLSPVSEGATPTGTPLAREPEGPSLPHLLHTNPLHDRPKTNELGNSSGPSSPTDAAVRSRGASLDSKDDSGKPSVFTFSPQSSSSDAEGVGRGTTAPTNSEMPQSTSQFGLDRLADAATETVYAQRLRSQFASRRSESANTGMMSPSLAAARAKLGFDDGLPGRAEEASGSDSAGKHFFARAWAVRAANDLHTRISRRGSDEELPGRQNSVLAAARARLLRPPALSVEDEGHSSPMPVTNEGMAEVLEQLRLLNAKTAQIERLQATVEALREQVQAIGSAASVSSVASAGLPEAANPHSSLSSVASEDSVDSD